MDANLCAAFMLPGRLNKWTVYLTEWTRDLCVVFICRCDKCKIK